MITGNDTMKKYTHAWLAFKAVERLENTHLSPGNRKYADSLIAWFQEHRDRVMQGAWYPDAVIKDMATSHVLKLSPAEKGNTSFGCLPTTHRMYGAGKASPLYKKPYTIERKNNLPDRCESIAHSVIDNLKMQEKEHKGSPVSPTDNHVALLLFMLSHYVADAHMPFHCDSRRFSEGSNLHADVEEKWDDEIRRYYTIDQARQTFLYNPEGYPLFRSGNDYNHSFLAGVERELEQRPLQITWGSRNSNIWDFMRSVCQYSYLVSHAFIPSEYDETRVTNDNWTSLPGQQLRFEELSEMVLADAIDSIARIWLRVWRKYIKWEKGQRSK
jgi:hypothetical protein